MALGLSPCPRAQRLALTGSMALGLSRRSSVHGPGASPSRARWRWGCRAAPAPSAPRTLGSMALALSSCLRVRCLALADSKKAPLAALSAQPAPCPHEDPQRPHLHIQWWEAMVGGPTRIRLVGGTVLPLRLRNWGVGLGPHSHRLLGFRVPLDVPIVGLTSLTSPISSHNSI